jgi:hypothetical protein
MKIVELFSSRFGKAAMTRGDRSGRGLLHWTRRWRWMEGAGERRMLLSDLVAF